MGHRDYDPILGVGIYTDCRDGVVYDNVTLYTAGGVPPKQVNLGRSNRRVNGRAGVQEEVFWVSSSTSAVAICDFLTASAFAAGIVEVTVAGLFNSVGARAVTRKYKIVNENNALSAVQISESGDTAELLSAISPVSGGLRLTFAQATGSATDTAVHVSLKSFAAGDSAFRISAIV